MNTCSNSPIKILKQNPVSNVLLSLLLTLDRYLLTGLVPTPPLFFLNLWLEISIQVFQQKKKKKLESLSPDIFILKCDIHVKALKSFCLQI